MMEYLQEFFKQKKKLLAAVIGLVLLNVLFFVAFTGVIEPRRVTAAQRYDELQRRSRAEGAADVSTLYKRGIEDLKNFTGRIPDKRQFPQLLGDLMEIALSSSVKVGKMSYKPQQLKEDNLLAYTLAMSVTGTYPAVKSFLADVQGKNELLAVEHASFANDDPYEESVLLDLKITIYLRNQGGV